ncbi:LolA family protein [Lentisalinibacter orientalis]|uniref:LolA family protein n=1 Tax=Lentisalinibacter orientalis TaxID=2992241 RepID=UPI003869F363
MTILAALLFSGSAEPQTNELSWTMDGALRQLDRQGSDLETVLAELSVSWQDDAGEGERLASGRIYINRDGDYRIATRSDDGMQILRRGDNVYYFSPALARVAEYRLDRHRNRVEPYLRLGFTITGRDLSKDYLVTFIGEERSGERRLLGLELTPKRDQRRALVSGIELWVDQASWLPARQVVRLGSGGGRVTLEYTQTARNLKLNPELFVDRWPRGTQKLRR